MARNYASIPLPASGDLLPCSGKLKSICAQRFRFPMSSRSQTKADAFRFLFLRARQDCLKMRRLFFARDDADFDFLEARSLQPAVQVAFRKSRPAATHFISAMASGRIIPPVSTASARRNLAGARIVLHPQRLATPDVLRVGTTRAPFQKFKLSHYLRLP